MCNLTLFTILIANLDPNTNKYRVMKGGLPAIEREKTKPIESEKDKYPRSHNRSFVMSEPKFKNRFDSIENIKRSTLKLK